MSLNRDICPRCKDNFITRHSALSRRDNETDICPECGTAEALEDSRLTEHWLDNPTNMPYWNTNSQTWLVQAERFHDKEAGLDVFKEQAMADDVMDAIASMAPKESI